MNILLDHMVPHALRHAFGDHVVTTVGHRGWQELENGRLLDVAQHHFDVLITIDNKLDSQQHVDQYDIAVAVLRTHPAVIERLRPLIEEVLTVIETFESGRVYRFER